MSKVKVRQSIPFDFRNQCHLIRSRIGPIYRFIQLSPKLSSSYTGASPLSIQRLNPECIQQYISSARQYQKDFQLKFVYACDEDIDEIQQLLSVLQAWKNDDILLMPLGGAPEIMRRNMRKTLEHCIRIIGDIVTDYISRYSGQSRSMINDVKPVMSEFYNKFHLHPKVCGYKPSLAVGNPPIHRSVP